jgi:hypothetical protein
MRLITRPVRNARRRGVSVLESRLRSRACRGSERGCLRGLAGEGGRRRCKCLARRPSAHRLDKCLVEVQPGAGRSPSRVRTAGSSLGLTEQRRCGGTSPRSGSGPKAAAGERVPADRHFHDLRHTGNHFAAASGASTRELMGHMGHVSMRAALIYPASDRGARSHDRGRPGRDAAGGVSGILGTLWARDDAGADFD